jgi:hypothetical protein
MQLIEMDGCRHIVRRVQIQPSIAKIYCVSLKRIVQCRGGPPASVRGPDVQALNLSALRKLPHCAKCDTSDHHLSQPGQPDPGAVFEIQPCKLVSRITRDNAHGFVVLLNDLIRSVDLYRCRSLYFESAHYYLQGSPAAPESCCQGEPSTEPFWPEALSENDKLASKPSLSNLWQNRRLLGRCYGTPNNSGGRAPHETNKGA